MRGLREEGGGLLRGISVPVIRSRLLLRLRWLWLWLLNAGRVEERFCGSHGLRACRCVLLLSASHGLLRLRQHLQLRSFIGLALLWRAIIVIEARGSGR